MPREDVILRFGADVAGLRQDMTQAQRTVDTAVRQMRNVLGTLGVGLSIGGVANAFGRIVAEGDRLQKLAIRIGATTENLSQLQFVAERSGIPFNTLATSLQRMQRRVSEAAQGTGEAKNALAELGLNAERLNLLRPTDQLLAVAEAMEDISNSGDRTRLLMRLFDQEGVAMGQAMEEGAAGIREGMRAADELGLTLRGNTADAMAETRDLMTELNARSTALGRSLAIELLPEVNEFLETLNQLANGPAGQGVKAILSEISAEVQFLASLLAGDWRSAWENFLPVRMLTERGEGWTRPPGGKLEIGVDGDALAGTQPEFASGVRAMIAAAAEQGLVIGVKNAKRDIEDQQRLWQNALKKYGDPEVADNWVARPTPNAPHVRGIAADLSYGSDAARQFAHENAGRFGLNFRMDHEPWHVELAKRQAAAVGDVAEAAKTATTATRGLTDAEREQQRLMREGEAVFEATRTAAEAHALEMDRLTELYRAGAIDLDTFGRAAEQSAEPLMEVETAVERTSRAAEDMGLAFESAMGRIITQGGNAREVMQALLQDIAQVVYRETAGKAISGVVGDVIGNIPFFGGGKAAGGPVRGGTPYVVGERGPELFVPAQSGSIVPNHQMGAAMSVTVNNMAPGVEINQRQDGNGLTLDVVRAALADDAARGGTPWVRNLAGAYGLGRGG